MASVEKQGDEHKKGSKNSEKVALKHSKKPARSGSSGQKKVFDVVRPGKAPALATSRPVLASQKPPVADDQFVAVKTAPVLRASDLRVKHELMDGKKKKSVSPLDTTAGAVNETPPKPAAENTEPAAITATAPVLSRLKGMETSRGDTAASTPQSPVETGPVTAPAAVPMSNTAAPSTTASSFLDDDPNAVPIWEMEDEPTPAHLAMEQTVDADDGIESHHLHGAAPQSQQPTVAGKIDAPGPSNTVSVSSDTPASPAPTAKTIDQLLAETGAPHLGNDLDDEGRPGLIVSHHKTSPRGAKILILFVALVVLAAITINLLLDAGYIDTSFDLPHTNIL